jgi:hypothetical protein
MSNRIRMINSLITVYLVHDKRLLAILSSDVMRDYVSQEHVGVLQRFIVQTFSASVHSFSDTQQASSQTQVCGFDGESRFWFGSLLSNGSEWLSKRAGSGKGKGMQFGLTRQLIANLDENCVVQPIVKQMLIDVAQSSMEHSDKLEDRNENRISMFAVGSFLIISDYVGFAFWRASTNPCTNVAGGGQMIPYILDSSHN